MSVTNQYTDGRYLEKVEDWHAGDSVWKAGKILEMMRRHRLEPSSVCDIGCGAGVVLAELQKQLGKEVRLAGYDISPQAIELAGRVGNETLQFFHLDYLSADVATPDLALVLDVFEHVPDYMGFLAALRKQTDWVIFHVPLDINAKAVLRRSRWMLYMRETYGHLHYFTCEAALATIRDAGYEIVDWVYTDDYDISKDLVPAVSAWKARLSYEIRRLSARLNMGFAAGMFEHFNVLVLARAKPS